ncbi:DNA polymerase III subunit gamma/tau [Dechloromonas denitrificans]|uniref:DNA polymerase III subunit gamma/tau n=1 Tax=Dechloromonas denitrificans TaxID=281362 RepID=UPI001CF842B0|nr:DNA polymerase III subunit gamma/tau [Dechloromonas denitrificans]UCV10887.1 DNA polymerase III subunit gamma/tau [Dechloromonas denitrificans]
MSYQVLARKWRPRNFSTLVGQEHVVRALAHALSEQRLHHAYLFTGTRGVGKTTIARILAKSLNCESGITATPCGVCSACQEIDSGRFVDLLEVDAATNTRVEEMRQLLENAVYAPTRGRFKVYVIDEVHMLSNSAFNAMLKTLEEPPEHVKFILATTDPQKIPVTVLSRCLQFNLKQMPASAITTHLAHILQAESVPFEPSALTLLARSASGSMRDALSLLDQAIAHGAGKVEESQVRSMLGSVDLDYLLTILDALKDGDSSALLQVAFDLGVRSLSYALALQELAALLTRIQIIQCVPSAVDEDDPERERLVVLAASFSPEFVQLAYQIVNVGRSEMASAPDEYAGFVMTLLRLFTFRPASVMEVVSSVRSQPKFPPGKPLTAAVAPSSSPAPVAVENKRRTAVSGGEDDWHEMVAALQLSGLARELAQHCELRELNEGDCLLRLAPAHAHLQMKPSPDKLEAALSDYLGRPLKLRIELDAIEIDTPAATASRERQDRQNRAIASIEQDSFIREAIESFDASLTEASIRPIS